MPNYCDYEMNIRGKKENVQKFLNWMQAEYDYGGNKPEVYLEKDSKRIPVEHHIGYRVFECAYDPEILANAEDEKDVTVTALGNVAWSIHCTMTGGPHSYYADCNTLLKSSYRHKPFFKQLISMFRRRKAITIDKACKKLHLEVELVSRESGCCFSEHMYINRKGKYVVNEATDYSIIDISEFDTYQEFIDEYSDLSETLTEDDFNNFKEDGCWDIELCEWLDKSGNFEFQFVN